MSLVSRYFGRRPDCRRWRNSWSGYAIRLWPQWLALLLWLPGLGKSDWIDGPTVIAVLVGLVGAVWVGIEGSSRGHIASLQADGSWTDVAMPADVVTSGIVQLAGDGTGAVWLFSGERGLVRRSADGTWDAFTGQPLLDLQPAGERQPYDPTLAIAPDGSAWLGGLPGEVRVRRPDGAWRSLMLLDVSSVRDIAFGPDGRAWMTMVDGGSPRVVEVADETTPTAR